ncbi:MAG TPA: hypothetical protein VLR91_10135, partial [Thermodesulfobacteriota bacterium]|nr:hypothetical protein [Thermodesulfobacteriota bacterium]
EFSWGDSFRTVEQTETGPDGKGKGKGQGRGRIFSTAFGSEVIRENVNRHALGLNVGYDWTPSFYSSAGYTYTILQGDSGTSNDHSVAVGLGVRF